MSALARALLASRYRAVQAKATTDWPEAIGKVTQAAFPKQRDCACDPARRVSLVCPRGAGKTTAFEVRFWRTLLSTPKARCLYVAPSRPQAEEILWEPLQSINERLGLGAVFQQSKLRVYLPRNKAALRLVGADDKRAVGRLRGIPHHNVVVDEAQEYKPQLLESLLVRVIGPRLGDFGGSLAIGGTPPPTQRGLFYEATRRGGDLNRPYADRNKPEFRDWKKWSSHHWTLAEGAVYVPAIARLWEEALVEKEAQGWSDQHPVWRREYLGEHASDDSENIFKYRPHDEDGNEYNRWDPERDRNGFAVLPEGHSWHYVVGMDLGHSDPFALDIFAYSPTYEKVLHVYGFDRREMHPREIAKVLIGAELDHDKYGGVIGAIGWPDGMVADTAGLGGAILDELQNVYGIRILPAEKKNKHDWIEIFNGDLIDGKIKILKDSALEEQLQDLQWAVDDYGNLKEDKSARNDHADAAVYARREMRHLFQDEPRPPALTARERVIKAVEALEKPKPRSEFDLWFGGETDEYDDFWG